MALSLSISADGKILERPFSTLPTTDFSVLAPSGCAVDGKASEKQLQPAVLQEVLPADIKVGGHVEGLRSVRIVGLGCNRAYTILEEYS